MSPNLRAAACVLLLAALPLAGCLGAGTQPLSTAALPPAFDAPGARVTVLADRVELDWKGDAGFGASLPVGLPVGVPVPLPVSPGSLNDAQTFAFDLPVTVTRLDANLTWQHTDVDLNLYVRNATGRTQCRSTSGIEGEPATEACSTHLVGPRGQKERWSALVQVPSNLQGLTTPEPFELRVNLSMAPWQPIGPALTPEERSPLVGFRTLRVDETHRSGEPSLKVDEKGAVYVAAPTGPLQSLWISRDGGQSFAWTDIAANSTPPRIKGVQGGGGDSDIAVSPDGQNVYFGDLWSCMTVASSHDGAKSWLNQPLACDLPGVDRQWLAQAGGTDVWLAYNGQTGMTVERSLDGGMTWPVQALVTQDNCARGNIVASQDGQHVYAAGCNDQGPGIAHSGDGGLTYEWQVVANRTGKALGGFCFVCGIFTVVAMDRGGNLYVVWADPTNGEWDIWMSTSADHAATWSAPVRVDRANGTSVLPWIAAAGPGHVVVAWYETKGRGDPNTLEGEWYVHAAEATNALDAQPTWEETLVSERPAQYGNVCINGSACGGGRNLLDFLNVAIDKDGRAHLAYVDGSYGGSAGNSFVMYAQMEHGLALQPGTPPTAPMAAPAPAVR